MNVLDLFSGIGGFSVGLERAGMRTVAFCEIDPYCQQVLRKHWPDVPVWGDVRTFTAETLSDTRHGNEFNGTWPAWGKDKERQTERRESRCTSQARRIDLVCGGFPCQDISVAGKGAGIDGSRSGLWSEFARIIGEVRPRYVIVENVAALLGRGIERVLGDLAALGYDAEWHCIPASAIGAPHRRDRVWIVAYSARAHERGKAVNQSCTRQWGHQSGNGGEDVADAIITKRRWAERTGWGQQGAGNDSQECGRGYSEADVQWLIEPDVGRVVDGLSFELDLVGEIERGNCNCQETEPKAQVVIWDLLRAMWRHREIAETSLELYRKRLYDSVPELPYGNPQSRWVLGPWIKKDKELCDLWEEFYAQPFQKAQDLQQRLLERTRAKKRPQALGSKVDRLRAIGNAIVPQIAEIIGKAIMTNDRA